MMRYKKHIELFFAACLLGLAAFLATYKLIESPPTWLDEGIITQVAINIAHHGPHALLQTAPGVYASAGYVTTSYPVTYPIALSFKLFGTTLFTARAVMALFIVLFVIAAYALARSEMSAGMAVASLALVTTFAPLYGNGKNVLGEVPGLLYTALFLLAVKHIEDKEAHWPHFLLAGILLGLAVATKPIFLLLLPPVGLVFLFSKRLLAALKILAALAGFALPMLLWGIVQFNGETLPQIFAVYANPHSNDLVVSFWQNAVSFATKPEPLYALLLLGAWILSILVRVWKKEAVSRAEWMAAGFAFLVYGAYLRGASYYRYFFLGEMLALVYLPLALNSLSGKKLWRYASWALLCLLFVFQLYQCFFHSWVAEHYASVRSKELLSLASIKPDTTVLVYQAPEAVVFLPKDARYYQYIKITQNIIIGSENTARLSSGMPDAVVIPAEDASSTDLSHYRLGAVLDRYSVWYKK